jgi:hypothetical protein
MLRSARPQGEAQHRQFAPASFGGSLCTGPPLELAGQAQKGLWIHRYPTWMLLPPTCRSGLCARSRFRNSVGKNVPCRSSTEWLAPPIGRQRRLQAVHVEQGAQAIPSRRKRSALSSVASAACASPRPSKNGYPGPPSTITWTGKGAERHQTVAGIPRQEPPPIDRAFRAFELKKRPPEFGRLMPTNKVWMPLQMPSSHSTTLFRPAPMSTCAQPNPTKATFFQPEPYRMASLPSFPDPSARTGSSPAMTPGNGRG